MTSLARLALAAGAALASLASLAAAPATARADTALVIVVENNDAARTGGGTGFLRALDTVGEPAYAAALRAAAAPGWDRVEVLTDEAARFDRFSERLRALDARGYVIDVVLDIHGSSAHSALDNRTSGGPDRLYFAGAPATPRDVAALGAPRPLRLNAVYMVSCWGSRFNEAWRQAGARSANGSRELNYYVLVSPLVFVRAFAAGATVEEAARYAYAAERALLDRSVVDRLLARTYGREGARTIHGADSSARVQSGPPVRSARLEGGAAAGTAAPKAAAARAADSARSTPSAPNTPSTPSTPRAPGAPSSPRRGPTLF